tara:strand:- start:125 stop:802 length:678 start_codon:yes stop_codon:yes gene_type:complete
MTTYSVLDASKKLGISTRAVQKRCKKDNIRKKDNKYLITDLVLEKWSSEIQSNEPTSEPLNSGTQELIKKYKEDIKTYEVLLEKYEVELEELDVARVVIKALRGELKLSKEDNRALQDELSQYDIADNERLEVFTNEMYAEFEERLNDWKLQNQKIISQQELFDAKEKGLNDVVNLMTEQADHYKNQFQYQKEQATRILDMHEQLIKTIQQNNFIEAKSKGFDKE